jgi:hypothetical protein
VLLAIALARAADDAPAALPTPAPPMEIDVNESAEVLRRRAEVYAVLEAQGYRKGRDLGDRTVFLPESPWQPRVVVHDDGYVYFRPQPPRIHAPGRSFSNQGNRAEYLLCIVAPLACVSPGSLIVAPRKEAWVKEQVLDATHEPVKQLNDAVARRAGEVRVNVDIPNDLARIWGDEAMGWDTRRAVLFEYWDSRTDTEEGEAAKQAIEAFLRGEVQQSEHPYTAEELAALNAKRESERPLILDPAATAR